jgi:hypothetical protein
VSAPAAPPLGMLFDTERPVPYKPSWPPIGTQVILRRPHIWQGFTGVVAAAAPALPTGMVVRLYENGKDVQVSDRAEFRVLPPEECRT